MNYHDETPEAVRRVLESCRQNGTRIRVRYGDPKTGRDWLEEHGVEGRVGSSTGNLPIPLLVHSRRSLGGPAMLDHCIVRIIESAKPHQVLYSHPKYNRPEFTIHTEECYIVTSLSGGSIHLQQVHARFKTVAQAERWVEKMSL